MKYGVRSKEIKTVDPKKEAGSIKQPLGLVPPISLSALSEALKHGADKYGPFNWRTNGIESFTYVHAMMRHLDAWRDGEDNDPQSGLSHIAHVMANCAILLDAAACNKLTDTRYKIQK